ncbi:MAG: hypothetical protein LBR70_00045 [Lactobacillaceae bacterium]|jgi:hypothetical protein|nr:hypothetical protein [Lactobacillaceae bacterium]
MANENITEKKSSIEEELWYLNNYVLLRDYYDRTVSRIAARCIRKGNIAIEDYPFYGYILDVLEEISEVGDYLLAHKELYPYIEKKIAGGIDAFKKNLKEYKDELFKNSSPDMIKDDTNKEIDKMRKALGEIQDKPSFDPTAGAGMGMDELMNKLLAKENEAAKGETRKVMKVKKAAANQAVPSKNETEE